MLPLCAAGRVLLDLAVDVTILAGHKHLFAACSTGICEVLKPAMVRLKVRDMFDATAN
jgi:hypothetical protein